MKDNITHYLNITRDYTHFNYGTTLTKKTLTIILGFAKKWQKHGHFICNWRVSSIH